MLEKLIAAPIPKKSDISAEAPTVVNVKDKNLEDLVTEESWLLFIHLNMTENVKDWHSANGEFEDLNSFKDFVDFVEKLSVTNDCAERNIGLIQDFINTSQNEDQRQNVLLVAREQRKLVSKEMPQGELCLLGKKN